MYTNKKKSMKMRKLKDEADTYIVTSMTNISSYRLRSRDLIYVGSKVKQAQAYEISQDPGVEVTISLG